MTTAREKAIERLAVIFEGYGACYAHRPEYATSRTTVAELEFGARGPNHLDPEQREMAAKVLDALSLVAIDPALVEAVEKAPRDPESDSAGDAHEDTHSGRCDVGNTCARCHARLTLADAVLAQLRGGR